jgi:ferrous-iron efflux pump FieF
MRPAIIIAAMDGQHQQMNLSAGLASLAVALVLVALKLWALAETGALSVAATLADSAMDLLMSLGALAAIIYAARPADEDHAFGHSSIEDLTALGQSALVIAAGLAVGGAAVWRLAAGASQPLQAEGAGIAVMVVSVVLTGGLVLWQGRVARTTGSRVVAADRLHYLGDLVPAMGAIIALMASATLGLGQIDAVVGLAGGAMLVFGGLRIGRGAWDALMDRRADPQIVATIAGIAGHWPGVRGFHDLKTRTAGSRIFVHLHIELDGDLPLRQAHDIGAGLRRAIMTAVPQADVIIHKDVARRPGP